MFEKEAKELLQYVGGSKNVNNLVHCATRLRFELKDAKKADQASLEKLSYVLSVVQSGGQYQVVIGPKVNDYYEEIIKHLDMKQEKKQADFSILKVISGAFSPLIPILAGAGMVKALLTVLIEFGMLTDASSTYAVLSAASNSIFYFMPIFLGITLSKQFGANPYVGGAIGAALLEPSFTALIGQEGTEVLGLPLTAVDYAATIFPIFVISFVYALLDKGLKKIIKQELQMFLVPMICLMVLVPMAVLVFGPFGTTVGNVVSDIVTWLFDFNRIIAGIVLGAAYPFLTMLGLHWGFTPITLQNLSAVGGDVIEGVAVCCVYAELGIAIGAYLKGKKHAKIKAIAGPTILTGFLAGVTEPILYGIVMRYKRLMAVVAISGAIGGALNGFFQVTMDAYVFHNVFSMAMMSYSPFIPFLIGIVASLLSGALLTYFWGISEDDREDFKSEEDQEQPEIELSVSLNKQGEVDLLAPVSGTIVALEHVQDEVFASGTAGKGIAIEPSDDHVYAPFDGEIVAVFPSKHAIGLRSTTGIEVLIHVGLNTVMLNGEHFTTHIAQGEQVKQGQLLLTFDKQAIKEAGYSLVTPVLITNAEQMQINSKMQEHTEVLHGSTLFQVQM